MRDWIKAWKSSAWPVGVWSMRPSWRVLRLPPKGRTQATEVLARVRSNQVALVVVPA